MNRVIMPSLLAHALLIIGIALIGAGIALSFRDQKTLPVTIMLLLGVLCCLVDSPSIQNIGIKSLNLDVTVTKQQLDQTVEKNQVDIIGPINLKIENVAKSLSAQEDVNKAIINRLNNLETSARPALASGPAPLIQPSILARNPTFLANNNYSVLVFYRDSRKDDATRIVPALTGAGFQASSINTTLDETQVGPQPDNSTYIVATDRGQSVEGAVAQILRQTLPAPRNEAITTDKPYTLRRGDLQIYLY